MSQSVRKTQGVRVEDVYLVTQDVRKTHEVQVEDVKLVAQEAHVVENL